METLPERIEHGGLVLRRWRVADAEAQAQAIAESADHLRPWMAWASETLALDDRRAMLAGWERDWATGGDSHLAILRDGLVLGSCGLHRRRGPAGLDIGYWTHVAFVRQGIATSAARMLTAAAFSVPGVDDVEIHHDRANRRSSGVPRALGFHYVGEQPDEATAPSEIGIDCTWRMLREQWDST